MKPFWKILDINVHDENADGPGYAIVTLNEERVRRIRELAKKAGELDVAYIVEWDCSIHLMTSDIDITGKYHFSECKPFETVTDRTSHENLGLLVNHNSEVVQLLARMRLAGYSLRDLAVLEEIKTLMKDYDSSVESESIQIAKNEFWYHGFLKHTDISYSSSALPLKALPRIK